MSCALLIAEPEPETGGFLERHLAEDGFEVLRALPGAEVADLDAQAVVAAYWTEASTAVT